MSLRKQGNIFDDQPSLNLQVTITLQLSHLIFHYQNNAEAITDFGQLDNHPAFQQSCCTGQESWAHRIYQLPRPDWSS